MTRSPDVTDAAVGLRIAARRSAIGLSQGALAQRVGISPQQIQKYEAGTNRIPASRLSAVASALGVPPGALFPQASGAAPVRTSQADLSDLRFMSASPEGRTIAAAFPLNEDRTLRQALAWIAEALAPSP